MNTEPVGISRIEHPATPPSLLKRFQAANRARRGVSRIVYLASRVMGDDKTLALDYAKREQDVGDLFLYSGVLLLTPVILWGRMLIWVGVKTYEGFCKVWYGEE